MGSIYPITPTLQPSSCQSAFAPLLEGYEVSTSTPRHGTYHDPHQSQPRRVAREH
nr:MAG TPA: hypothetical protein [Bacteriophage sp.]